MSQTQFTKKSNANYNKRICKNTICNAIVFGMIKIKLREMAERHGIKSAYQLQTLLNIQPSVAAKWFKNDMKMIGFESLNILCKYFNCEITDILIYTPDKDARKSFRETKVSAEAKVKLDKIREMRAKVKEFIATQLDDTKISDTQTKTDVGRATKISNTEIDTIKIKDSIIDNKNNFDTSSENPQTDNILLSHSSKDNVQLEDTKFDDTKSKNIQTSNTSDNEPSGVDTSKYYTRHQLEKRGWTDFTIERLGKPAVTKERRDAKNPLAIHFTPYYLVSKVEAMEKTRDFAVWQERAAEIDAPANEPLKSTVREKAAKTKLPVLPDGDTWITTMQIAKRLGLSKKSVTDYINKKILPSWQAADRTPHYIKESDYPAFEAYYRNLTGKSKS
jgi:putative transcriptional regulator